MNHDHKNLFFKALTDVWQNCVLGLKMFIYGLLIVFFIIGIMALVGGAIGLGIILMALNGGVLAFFLRLDKKADKKFDQDFDEMVRKNKGE